MTTLTGKVAVVTGGGSERGIGRATGTLLVENGAQVVLDAIHDGRNWAVPTPDTDERIFGGRLSSVADSPKSPPGRPTWSRPGPSP
ncbi:hypothetical protein OG216_01930 [Streptomycetaceae bacterium NBC_01309]